MSSTPAYRELIDAIARLQRVQREVGNDLARDFDCPRAALNVLWLLEKCGEMGIGDMAQHLHVDISVASRQASSLVDVGYAERSTPDAPGTDRRVRTVRLTEAGREFTADTRRQLDERAAAVFSGWSVEDLMETAARIDRIADTVIGVAGPGRAALGAHTDAPVSDTSEADAPEPDATASDTTVSSASASHAPGPTAPAPPPTGPPARPAPDLVAAST